MNGKISSRTLSLIVGDSPESSTNTSIKRRIEHAKEEPGSTLNLAEFVGNPREPMPAGLPFDFKDYLELVDWTGRIVREDKRGAISANLSPILERLDISTTTWVRLSSQFETQFRSFAGEPHRVKSAALSLGFTRTPHLSRCKAAFT